MPGEETEHPYAHDLRARIRDLRQLNVVEAAQSQALGLLNFKDIVPQLVGLEILLGKLANADLSSVPLKLVLDLNQRLQTIEKICRRIETFDIRQNNAVAERDALQSQIGDQYAELFSRVMPIVGFGAAVKEDLEAVQASLANQVDAVVTSVLKRQGATLDGIVAASKQSHEILDAMRTASAKVGISVHSRVFEEQAKEHKWQATMWALATLVAAFVTVAWGAAAVWWLSPAPTATAAVIVQETLGKFIIFSGLSYALLWSARNYSANRHNYVLNKHKENSLRTFETFAKAADSDPDIKSAILLQATTSIFAAQATGYTTKEPDVDQPSKIIEIMRSVKG
jgi:hypothetical protein